MKLITQMSGKEALEFFLKHENYCNFSLPAYFNFSPLLEEISSSLNKKGSSGINFNKASSHEGVNYKLYTNKNSYYSWRLLELIHPVIYVHLVHQITEEENWKLLTKRFKKFNDNKKIICASLPRETTDEKVSNIAQSVSGWWIDVEQESINKALDFRYLFTTDIANFYPSIYTHSIPWAIYTKEKAKNSKTENNVGNFIDKALRQMSWGQTNGIPQGSVLMDFIAELVLGYCDEILEEKLSERRIDNYFIIRYRDDYRVFTNSKEDAELIAKELALILQDMGLQLNESKTSLSEDIIFSSIKLDKQEALMLFGNTIPATTIQGKLLKLAKFSRIHKNSGQLNKYLAEINKCLRDKKEMLHKEVRPIVSIIVDIMMNNPRTFSSCALVLSSALKFIESNDEKIELIQLVKNKFNHISGTVILDIWLQRISYHINPDIEYNEPLCSVVSEKNLEIWNSNWIKDESFKNIMTTSFIDREVLKKCKPVIPENEVVLYPYDIDFDDPYDIDFDYNK
ncbi:reverse transcriptase [Mergibacter septicus]|uniref:RNA-directed DNA polymerase n=1 Tax=Mergibacter septicus TaxID=221402 RepID=UPI001C77ED85|nr:RNA-directed DNA polymerase [Mergibacter septicus]QDJ12354.1 reverse transcriptase [Mergibacter septicus]